MIGNDIVDFAQAAKESNWRRRGWLDKVFIPEEQLLIENAANPDRMVWLLWSMKEAVYKAHQRKLQHAPRCNPKSFTCSFLNLEHDVDFGSAEIKGNVIVEGYEYCTTSSIPKDFVHTTATGKGSVHKLKAAVMANPNTQYIFDNAIQYLPQKISTQYQLHKDSLGIPQIFDGTYKTSFLISLSHHGRFGGCYLRL